MRIHHLILPLIPLTSCATSEPSSRAFRITSLSEAVGGPKAMAQPGDFMLENDRVRVAILDARPSMGPHTSGASLIDADLQRNDPSYAQGRGLDQLAEIFPTVNLNVQQADETAGTVAIIADGSDGGPAIICTEGPEVSFLTLLDALWGIQWPGARPHFRMRTDYELRPDEAVVRMRTTAVFSGEEGCEGTLDSLPAEYSDTTLPVLELALQNGAGGGLAFGDFYLQGGSVNVFTPGHGFDEQGMIYDLTLEGLNTFSDPIAVPFLAGVADRVSYGIMSSEGSIFVPMFTSSQTLAIGAGLEGDGTSSRFPADTRVHYDRMFSIGQGDVGSALDALLEARGDATGRVTGFVVEQSTGMALSDASVLVYQAGGDEPWSQWSSDVGQDSQIDGSFGGTLPPGEYELLVHKMGRPDGPRVPFTLAAGDDLSVVLESPEPGGVRFQIVDETGFPVPAKLTIYATDNDSPLDPALGDPFIGDAPARVIFTTDGAGELSLPPGKYQAVASRGIEYELGWSSVFEVGADQAQDLTLQVVRSVDTSGWISADLHVHAYRSHDSGVSLHRRVTTMVSEGVEFIASTDHDYVTDYAPAIHEMGVEEWIGAAVGLEVTTLELGHFLGFPLLGDHIADAGGAMDWTGLDPEEIVDGIRSMGVNPTVPEETVVFVGHPRDGILGYFDQYGMTPYESDDGEIVLEDSLLVGLSGNELLDRSRFTDDFDGLEVLNGKRMEMIRTPTQAELDAYGDDPGAVPVYEMMARTMEEQQALIAGAEAAIAGDDLQDGEYLLGYGVEGVLDDWFTLNNLGYRYTALGNSDTHGTTSTESGCPRNYIVADTDSPAFVSDTAVAAAVAAGRVITTYGPFLRFYAGDETQGPGSDVSASGPLSLTIEVQSPTWFDVDRVELYENGTLIEEWTEDEIFNEDILNLATDVTVEPTKDSWYVLVALGQDDLSPVFTTVEIPPIQLEDVVIDALAGVGLDSFLGDAVPIPRAFPVHPYAVTNPIWVDVDGDGEFTPPGLPDWMVAPSAPED